MTCPRCQSTNIVTRMYKRPKKESKMWELNLDKWSKVPCGCLFGFIEWMFYAMYLFMYAGIWLLLLVPRGIAAVYKIIRYGDINIDDEHKLVCGCAECGFKWEL